MCCIAKTLWILTSVYSMILSLCLIGLSITSLLTYYCSFNRQVSTFQDNSIYLTYVTYFYNDKCVNNTEKFDFVVLNTVPSERTWIWTIAYLALNVVWFFTSILLLQAKKYWTATTGLWLTYPWIFTAFVVLCTDVAATVMYALDYNDVETVDRLEIFIQLIRYGIPGNYNATAPYVLVVMIGVFSKAIVGWILLLVLYITICVIMCKKVGPKEDQLLLQTRPPPFDYYAPSVNPAYQDEMTEIGVPSHRSPQTYEAYEMQTPSDDLAWRTPWPVLPRVPIRYNQRTEDQQWQPEPTSPVESYDGMHQGYDQNWSPPVIGSRQLDERQRPWSYLPQPQPPTEVPAHVSHRTHHYNNHFNY